MRKPNKAQTIGAVAAIAATLLIPSIASASAEHEQCQVTIENQFSERSGTDVRVYDQGKLIGVINNVEREAFLVTQQTFRVTSVDNVDFEVIAGPEGVHSIHQQIECDDITPVEPPTTVTPTTETPPTTVTPTTETPPTTVTPTTETPPTTVTPTTETPQTTVTPTTNPEPEPQETALPEAKPAEPVTGEPVYAG